MEDGASEPIVVTAPRLPEAPAERAYSALEIDPRLLDEAIRLDRALTLAPGVSLFRRNDSAAANPTIQGISVRASAPSGAGRALVTLDGVPLNDPFGGWVIWGAAPPETIAGASIVRGAGAGPYGAGALTGAAQLEERQSPGAAATLEHGERGHMRASGAAEARNDALSFMLAGAAQREDGWVPVRAGAGAADVPLFYDGASGVARVQWRGGGALLSLRLSGYSEARGNGLAGGGSQSSGALASITFLHTRDGFDWRVQAWAHQSDLANDFVSVASDRSASSLVNQQYATPALGWGANAAARWSGESHGLELGADLRMADGETRERYAFSGGAPTRARTAGGRSAVAGVYAEAWREAGPFLFSGGLRADIARTFDGHRNEILLATGAPTLSLTPDDSEHVAPTARLGMRRQLNNGLFARGAIYAGFRPPSLNELHRPFRVGNDVTEANPALKPERLAGADFALGGAHRRFDWSVGVFATRLEDAIVNVTQGAGPGTFPPGVFVPNGGAYRRRENAGLIDAAGIEAEASGAWADALRWHAALNYTDARVDGGGAAPALTGLRPAQTPNWSASAGLVWRVTGAAALSADLRYESARFEDDLNSRELAPAVSADVRLSYDISPRVAVFAALDNAFDAAIETAETADGVESFAAPRTLRFGLRFRALAPGRELD